MEIAHLFPNSDKPPVASPLKVYVWPYTTIELWIDKAYTERRHSASCAFEIKDIQKF